MSSQKKNIKREIRKKGEIFKKRKKEEFIISKNGGKRCMRVRHQIFCPDWRRKNTISRKRVPIVIRPIYLTPSIHNFYLKHYVA
jgi:hypothetical protein